MQTDHVKVALMAAWVLAFAALGYLAGTASIAAWAGLALVSLAPPAIMMRLWTTPAPTMSESIRNVLR